MGGHLFPPGVDPRPFLRQAYIDSLRPGLPAEERDRMIAEWDEEHPAPAPPTAENR